MHLRRLVFKNKCNLCPPLRVHTFSIFALLRLSFRYFFSPGWAATFSAIRLSTFSEAAGMSNPSPISKVVPRRYQTDVLESGPVCVRARAHACVRVCAVTGTKSGRTVLIDLQQIDMCVFKTIGSSFKEEPWPCLGQQSAFLTV